VKLAILILFATACEAPAPVTPILSVLKRTDSCFALMTPDNPVPDELAVPDVCPGDTFPTIYAGVDLIEVVIDYGPDVDFAVTTVAPTPEVDVVVDGVRRDVHVDVSPEQRLRARAFFLATFRAPAVSSTDVRIAAGAGEGFRTESSTIFATVPPPIAFGVAECQPGLACSLFGAVGQVHATISVPGDVAVPIAIHQTIDGFAQPDPVTVTATPHGGSAVATVALDVPAATTWSLAAQLGDGASAPVTIALTPPIISSHLSCGSPCTIAKGGQVGLSITAPAGIHPAQALVTTRLGGVPQLIAVPIELHTSGAVATGLVTLTAPTNAIGSYEIDVSVAGFAAPTIEANVQ
jgi:hypothetical protein